MAVSEFFHDVWDFLRRSFEDCKSCSDVLDPYYYSKTSPGVRKTPPKFDRACWENDLKYDFSISRPPPSFQPSSDVRVGLTLSHSRSHSASQSFEEEDQQIQFLFYGGSDISTPRSTEKLCRSRYRNDVICKPISQQSRARPSPKISHKMPCFVLPRDTPVQSPSSAPTYSPHLFVVSKREQYQST